MKVSKKIEKDLHRPKLKGLDSTGTSLLDVMYWVDMSMGIFLGA